MRPTGLARLYGNPNFDAVYLRSSVWTNCEELNGVKDNTTTDFTDRGQRPAALSCGPVLGNSVTYDTRNLLNLKAAVSRNQPRQIRPLAGRKLMAALCRRYVDSEASDTYDAFGIGNRQLHHTLDLKQVIMRVAEKSPAKAQRYLTKYLKLLDKGAPKTHWEGTASVKSECMKCGIDPHTLARTLVKCPRFIFGSDSGDVVACHMVVSVIEDFIATRNSFKGLRTNQKHQPIEKCFNEFRGDCYIICIDDTARDGNTQRHDFDNFLNLCRQLCIGLPPEFEKLMSREGYKASSKWGSISSRITRLFSGCSFTSALNWVTTRFFIHSLCLTAGVNRKDYAGPCEGDDNAVVVRGAAYSRVACALCDDNITSLGRLLGKDIKIEKRGWLRPDTSWPIVGGFTVYDGSVFSFVPSPSRAVVKAGWALRPVYGSYKATIGSIKSRSESLNDRFDGVPVFYSYARLVASRAALHTGIARRTPKEEYDRQHSTGIALARKPNFQQRRAFEIVTGCSPGHQESLEELLTTTTDRKDWNADLRDHFEIFW